MDLGITGRTAVVCASTSGLGEAIARALAAESAHLVVSGRRGERAPPTPAALRTAAHNYRQALDQLSQETGLAA